MLTSPRHVHLHDLVMIGLVYMAYPSGSQHEYTFLPRLRPYMPSWGIGSYDLHGLQARTSWLQHKALSTEVQPQ